MRARLFFAAGIVFVAVPAASQTDVAATDAAALSYRLPGRPLEALEALSREARTARPDSLRPPPDDWLGYDKGLHVGASFLLTLSGQYVFTDKAGLSNDGALPFSVGAALALGIAKEVADSRRTSFPLFSLRDLAADALGVAAAALVTRF